MRIYFTNKLDIYDPRYTLETFVRGLARTVAKRYRAQKPLGSPYAGSNADGTLPDEVVYERLNTADPRQQQALGFGRVRHSSAYASPSPLFLETLELLFAEGGYPHQQIAFAFNILLFGKKKRSLKRNASFRRPEIFGDPKRVVREIGSRTLHQAALELEQEIQATLGPTWDLTRYTHPLFAKLEKTGQEVFGRDPTSLRHLPHLREKVLRDTLFRDYFGKDPRKSVTDWSYAVSQRLRRATGRKGLN